MTSLPSGGPSPFLSPVHERIPEDDTASRAAHALVRPGGAVVIFVTSFRFAMSRFDKQIGHVHRYIRHRLVTVMASAGPMIHHAGHVNMPGLLAWSLGMRPRRMPAGEGRLLSAWDRLVVPAARGREARERAPFGQSVFAVGHVRGAQS